MSDNKKIISRFHVDPDDLDIEGFDAFDRQLGTDEEDPLFISEDLFRVNPQMDEPEIQEYTVDQTHFDDGMQPESVYSDQQFDFSGSYRQEEESDGDAKPKDEIHSKREQMEAEIEERIMQAQRKALMMVNEAETQLRDAQRQAEAILEKARAEADQIEANAYQAGFAHGEEAGRALNEQKIEAITRNLESVLEELGAQRSALIQENEEELVRISFMLASKILHREIYENPGSIVDLVKNSLDRLKHSSQLTIYVSPHDFRFLEDHIENLTSYAGDKMKLSVEPDSNIARGGCLVKSDTGEVDATIDTMLKKLQSRIWSQEPEDALPEMPSDDSEPDV